MVQIQISKKFKKFTLDELAKNNMKILNIQDTNDKVHIGLEKYPTKIKSLLKTDWEMV